MKEHCAERVAADSLMVILSWGTIMQRDDDLARQILLEIEAHPDPLYEFGLFIGDSAENRVRYYHLRLLEDAGFLEESGREGGVWRITNAGHDFLSLTRKSETWEMTKAAAAGLTGASLGILRDIALGLARQSLAKLGLPL